MALILNIETTTTACSVALSKDGHCWIVRESSDKANHAERLTLFIEEIFEQAQLSIKDIDAVAVSKGPGSYTGLRIGMSTAKGICYTLDKPLIAVDTLQALAAGAQFVAPKAKSPVFVSLIDARRMDAYAAWYDKNLAIVKAPFFTTLTAESLQALEQDYDAIILAGDAVEKAKPLFEQDSVLFSPVVWPSARYMSPLAEALWAQKAFEDVAYIEPFYLKKPNITKAKPKFLL